MDKIKNLSEKMLVLFEILLILAPISVVAYWSFYEFFSYLGIDWFSFNMYNQQITVNFTSKALAIAVMCIPTGIIMYGLVKLKKLFSNYAANQMFSEENVHIYRKLGTALFALVIADIICTPLMSLVLSFQNPVGSRFITLSFGTSEIITLIIGFIVMTISYVMKRAHQLELDAEHTI